MRVCVSMIRGGQKQVLLIDGFSFMEGKNGRYAGDHKANSHLTDLVDVDFG